MEAQPSSVSAAIADLRVVAIPAVTPVPMVGSNGPVRRRRRLPRFDPRPLILPVLLLLAWEAFAHAGLVNKTITPTLATVGSTLVHMVATGDLWLHTWATLQRILLGFGIASVTGVLVGIACARSMWFDRIIGTPLVAVRQVPLFGWIPLLAVLIGIGEGSKIGFVILAAFYPVALNTTQAIRNAPADLLEVGRILRFSDFQLLRRILLPNALPSILTGLKHGLNFAGVAVIAAEVFMTASPGLGNLLEYGQINLRTDLVLIGVAAIGALGLLLNLIIDRVSARLLRWRPMAH